MKFTSRELAILARIRARFLDGSNAAGGYWRDDEELALYDTTFAERIGWKWDAVLAELATRGWTPNCTHVLDFACGTGVASRRALAAFPALQTVAFSDVSAAAVRFATQRCRVDSPNVAIRDIESPLPPGTLLLVSHVINELTPAARSQLMHLATQAHAIIWLEAGSSADSRALGAVREELRRSFSVIAPCPHQGSCGIFAPGNERHWCHFFTPQPAHAAQDARWSQIGRDLGIDLRSIPYSFLVLARPALSGGPPARVLGTPVETKGKFTLLTCEHSGVREVMAQKRDVPELFRVLRKGRQPALKSLTVEAGRISHVELVQSHCDAPTQKGDFDRQEA